MKKEFVLPVFLLLSITAVRSEDTEETALTPQELRKQGIVSLLDHTVELKAVVMWEHMSVKIPEDQRNMEEVAKEAGPLKISFDGTGFEDIALKKYFLAAGEKLRKTAGTGGKESYVFGDKPLVNGQVYILKVRIRLRPSFKAEMLENPAFVKQCNNPRYWSQTFELDIMGVR